MGQSTMVAAAFSATIFLLGMFVNISMNLNSMQTITSITEDKVAQIEKISGQRCKLESWKTLDADNLLLNITNTGEVSIRLSDFKFIEIFGLTSVNGTAITVRLQYNDGSLVDDYWQLTRVFFNGHEGERLNPLVVSSSSGSWDPDETIEVGAKMIGMVNGLEYTTVVMSSGFESSLGLNSGRLSGITGVPAGSVAVVVQHGLRTIPSNVQVTPSSKLQSGFWVSNLTSNTFTINMNSSEDHEVTFYWFVSP
jgi:hypothetical protein